MDEIIQYYTDLLIVQYHNKPKARAHIAALIKVLLADGLLFKIRDAFNLDTAVGVQLDIVGKYAGIDRFYKGQNFSGFFAFTTYDEVSIPPTKRGFSQYSNFETKEGKWLQYGDVLSTTYALNDDDYRFIIRLKIAQNNGNHSHKYIDDSMFQAFGTDLVPDSDGNMVMNYFYNGANSAIVGVAFQKQVLPRPMGVRLNYVIDENLYFGYSTYEFTSGDIEGYSTYSDYDTKPGAMLLYNNLMGA